MSLAAVDQPQNPCPGGYVVLSDEGSWCAAKCPADWDVYYDGASDIAWCFTEGKTAPSAPDGSVPSSQAAVSGPPRALVYLLAAVAIVGGAYWYRSRSNG